MTIILRNVMGSFETFEKSKNDETTLNLVQEC